jgi:hypothetical protein
MIKLTDLLKEIKVKKSGDHRDLFWANSLYEFFKNDQDIFKNSQIDNIIKQDIYKIVDLIWDSYAEYSQEYDIEEFNNGDITDYPKTKQDMFNPKKQTARSSDTEYFEVGEFLLPYILKHLKENGWEPVITDDWIDAEFSKDGKEVNIFDYIKPFEDQDTSPRENLYEKFVDYIEDNYDDLLNEIQVNPTAVRHLINLDIGGDNYSNQNKLIDFLGQYVTRPDIYKNENGIWEGILFNTYDEWINNWKPDEEEIESAPDQEEWDSIHNEMQDKYNYNYFVRNFTIGDEEDTRHEDDIHKGIQHFMDIYNVPNHIAIVMKKLVDEYLAPSLDY